MSSSRAALLIGKITHARKEWEQIGSLLKLQVRQYFAFLEEGIEVLTGVGICFWITTRLLIEIEVR